MEKRHPISALAEWELPGGLSSEEQKHYQFEDIESLSDFLQYVHHEIKQENGQEILLDVIRKIKHIVDSTFLRESDLAEISSLINAIPNEKVGIFSKINISVVREKLRAIADKEIAEKQEKLKNAPKY